MSPEKKTTRKAIRRPFARMMKILSILGSVILMCTALLMACLFFSLAKAADNSNVLRDSGNLIDTVTLASGCEGSGDMDQCGIHDVDCYDRDNTLLGLITNSPCYWNEWECNDRSDMDLIRCKIRFGETVVSSQPGTWCHWDAGVPDSS